MQQMGLVIAFGMLIVGGVIGKTAIQIKNTPSPIVDSHIKSEDSTPTLTPTPTPTPTPTLTPTPTPTPTPILIPYTSDDLERWFSYYADKFGISREVLKKIAQCESGYTTTSYNEKYDYAGMYQFSKNTWISTRKVMGEDVNADLRFDPEEAIKTAAFKISQGGINAWPNCR